MHAKASRQQSSQAEQRSVPAQPGFVGLKPAGPAGLVPGLQHSHGNRFVQRWLETSVLRRSCGCGICAACAEASRTERPAGLQPKSSGFATFIPAKLTVSEPGDADELEADRVAEEVMRMSDRLQ